MELPRLSAEEHVFLSKPFSVDEIWLAMKSTHPTKAPEPDGFHAQFYQQHWETVGPSISNMLLIVLNSGGSMHMLNDTFITLISKIKKPKSMMDFHPISLCNVLYKIFSKVLVNRIKPILSNIIGDAQSAFVSNRLILYNIIIASEVFHWLITKHQSSGKDAYAIKIDMGKAYDRVECIYLK